MTLKVFIVRLSKYQHVSFYAGAVYMVCLHMVPNKVKYIIFKL